MSGPPGGPAELRRPGPPAPPGLRGLGDLLSRLGGDPEHPEEPGKTGSAGGSRSLQEPEGMPLLEALGFSVPAWSVLASAQVDPDLSPFPGERVVVKLLDPEQAHRTEVGGVRVVPREKPAVRAALAALREKASGPRVRFLLQEWVPHETGPGGELLLGYRWTREFGPVVTLGLGGVDAEVLAAAGRPGALQWIGAPGRWDRTAVARALTSGPLGALATGRTRARTGRVTEDQLARAVVAFLELAAVAPAYGLREVEVNPLVFRGGQPVALDVLVRVGRGPPESGTDPPDRRGAVRALLEPTSMAVVGASGRALNPGRVILRNVVRAGFPPERVQVVKAGCETLEGCPCVPGVEALAPVDLLVVSVAAPAVPPLLETVARNGLARSVILVTAGLDEGGGDGAAPPAPRAGGESARAPRPSASDELDRVLALPGAPVLNGGNCLGIRSVPGRYDTLFLPSHKLDFPPAGEVAHPVALLTQSGAFAVARASALPWLNPRYVVTVGNQMDLTVGEYVEALQDDTELRVIAAYVEGFRPGDGLRFLEAAERHREAGRTVLLYRAGRTPHGADAMASHTASVAGNYAVTRALAEARGVLVAETLQDFQDLLALAVRLDDRVVGGRRAGFLSNAGFECVAMADAAGSLLPAEIGPATTRDLGELLARAGLAGIVRPRNPLDVTPILGDEGFARAAAVLLDDEGVDVGVVGCVPMTPALRTLAPSGEHEEDVGDAEGVAARLGRLFGRTRKAWLVVVDGGPRYRAFARTLEEAGVPVLRQGDRAVALLGQYVEARLSRPGA